MNNCKIVIKLVLFHQLDCFTSLSKMWLPEQFKLSSTKVLSTGLIVSICLGLSLFIKALGTWEVPTLSVSLFICLCDLLDLQNGSFKLKMKLYDNIGSKNENQQQPCNSKHNQFLPFDKYAGIAYLITLTQMLIVFRNVCYSAYKLICFSYSVVIVRAQINISGGYRPPIEIINFHPCAHMHRSEILC